MIAERRMIFVQEKLLKDVASSGANDNTKFSLHCEQMKELLLTVHRHLLAHCAVGLTGNAVRTELTFFRPVTETLNILLVSF